MRLLVPALALWLIAIPPAAAQSVHAGGEVVSRYVWRGQPYGSSPMVQPWLSLDGRGFEAGTWGSYAVDGSWKEQDLWTAWSGATPAGTLTLTLFDYFYPDAEGDLGRWGNWGGVEDGEATGAHTVEASAKLEHPRGWPVSVEFAFNAYNSSDDAPYLELATYRAFGAVDAGFQVGFALDDSSDYGSVPGGGPVNLALTLSRSLVDVSGHGLLARVTVIRNPHIDRTLWVMAVGL